MKRPPAPADNGSNQAASHQTPQNRTGGEGHPRHARECRLLLHDDLSSDWEKTDPDERPQVFS